MHSSDLSPKDKLSVPVGITGKAEPDPDLSIPVEGLDAHGQGKHFLFSVSYHTKDMREGKRKQAEE